MGEITFSNLYSKKKEIKMSKLVPIESPWIENPEVVVPGIVAYKGIETYHNISTLHDEYDRLVGVNRTPAVVSSSTLNDLKQVNSSGGSYIATRPNRNRAPTQPTLTAS